MGRLTYPEVGGLNKTVAGVTLSADGVTDGGKSQKAINAGVKNHFNRAADDSNRGYVVLSADDDFATKVGYGEDLEGAANTTYEIDYVYDLDGESVTLPSGCILKFNGGGIENGTLVGDGTIIDAPQYMIFDGVTFSGTWICPQVHDEWFNEGSSFTDLPVQAGCLHYFADDAVYGYWDGEKWSEFDGTEIEIPTEDDTTPSDNTEQEST